MTNLPASTQASGEGMAAVAAPVKASPAGLAAATLTPLSGGALLMVGFVLAFANFMAVLDTTIANVSVPNIAGGLAVSPNEGTWVITSYSVAEAITVPLTGWLAQRFGSVRTFVSAVVMFGICSALCGLAPSLGVLVVFRVMQGLSGGPMIPLSQVLLLRVFPKNKAGQAMGLWGMTTVVAPVLGPILGGKICDSFDWPWVFYINVPFAMICAALAWRLVRPYETPKQRKPVDGVGLMLMVVWVAALEIMLDKGEELDWFGSSFIVALLATAVIGFMAFVIWELTDPNPIVNLRVFRSRGFTMASASMCLAFGSYFASVVLIPLWLQTNMGYTATWAGIAVAPQGLLAIVFAPIVGRLIGKVDSRVMISCGVLWLAFTMFWRSHYASNVDLTQVMIPQLIQGLGVAFFFIPVFGLAIGALRPEEAPGGAGLLSFLRTMSGAFAVSLTTTAWSNAGIRDRVALLNQSNGPRALTSVGAAGLQPSQTLGQIESIIRTQSVMLATDQMFFVIAVIMVMAAGMIWLSPKPQRAVQGGGGH